LQLGASSLADWLEKNNAAPSRKISRSIVWFKQIVAAVAYMHDKNLIHRDLKPANILFFGEHPFKRLKLCDVGISAERRAGFYTIDTSVDRTAKFQNVGMPKGGRTMEAKMKELQLNEIDTAASRTQVGTPLYMSPEQQSIVANYSSKTDVFALGLILAELCVAMTTDERQEVFDDIQRGRHRNIIEDIKTAEFINLLTHIDPARRPTCNEILDHPYINLNDHEYILKLQPFKIDESGEIVWN
ncbi:hypothetical protein PMAYCL1PPCAC_04726, partial [Pristionchus mayeri]